MNSMAKISLGGGLLAAMCANGLEGDEDQDKDVRKDQSQERRERLEQPDTEQVDEAPVDDMVSYYQNAYEDLCTEDACYDGNRNWMRASFEGFRNERGFRCVEHAEMLLEYDQTGTEIGLLAYPGTQCYSGPNESVVTGFFTYQDDNGDIFYVSRTVGSEDEQKEGFEEVVCEKDIESAISATNNLLRKLSQPAEQEDEEQD